MLKLAAKKRFEIRFPVPMSHISAFRQEVGVEVSPSHWHLGGHAGAEATLWRFRRPGGCGAQEGSEVGREPAFTPEILAQSPWKWPETIGLRAGVDVL